MCKTNGNQKWNHELRVIIYKSLLREFGEYDSFEGFLNPKGESKQLTALINELQITLKQISGQEFSEDAIKQQMAFALTKQKEFKHRGHIYSWIMNVAAALEAGYIKSSILPDVTLSDKNNV